MYDSEKTSRAKPRRTQATAPTHPDEPRAHVWNDALVEKIKDRYKPEKVNEQESAGGGKRKKEK